MKNRNLMITLGVILAAIVILGVMILVIFNQATLGIKDDIVRFNSILSYKVGDLNKQADSMVLSFRSMLDEQRSLFADYTIAYGKPDLQSRRCDVTVTIVPKTYTSDTTAKILIDDKEASMTQTGNAYAATITLPIIDEEHKVSVTFETNGVKHIDALPEAVNTGAWLINRILANTSFQIVPEKDAYYLNGVSDVSFHSGFPETIESASFIAIENGNEIWRQPVTVHSSLFVDAQQIQTYAFEFDPSKTVLPSYEKVSVLLEVKCASGLVYRQTVMGMDTVYIHGVYDSDGNEIISRH